MTEAWNSFAMRPNTSSTEGQVPNTGIIYDCPDIIPVASATVDPQNAYKTADSWATTYSNQVRGSAPNFIYVRGKNWASGAETATVTMYAVPSSLISWPSQWLNSPLAVQTGDGTDVRSVELKAEANQQIVVGAQPFYWNAPPPPPGSDHYCLFALVDTPSNPNPLLHRDVKNSYTTMADLVTNTLYVGWKNVAEVDANAPTWTNQVQMTVPEGAAEGDFLHVYVYGTAGTVGGQVEVVSGDGDGFSPPINIPQQTVERAGATYGMLTTPTPGVANTILNISFWNGSATPRLGDGISAVCGWVPPTKEAAQPYIDRGVARALPEDRMGGVGVEVLIGAMNYRFTAAP